MTILHDHNNKQKLRGCNVANKQLTTNMWPGPDHPPHPPPARRINNRSNEDWEIEVSRSLAGEVSGFITTRGGKMPMSITPAPILHTGSGPVPDWAE